MPFTIKAWEDLTIQDDFMFKAVMKDKALCQGVLEAILGQRIRDIHYLSEELSLKAGYMSKGVRLDVYVEDEAHTIYDVEMQVRNETDDDLPCRMRYYQSQIDAEILARGKDYAELRQTLVIFICPFDPCGRGWHLYTFENTCQRDPALKLGDGAVKILLNTCGTGENISPQLQAFMDYVNSGILTANPLVQALDQRVKDVKHSEAERVSYMTYELHLRDARKAGEAEGEERGLIKTLLENIRSLMKSLDCDAGKAMDLLNVSAADRQTVLGQL
jgi:predicted transposase/invertase (TIGR01784 family)